MIIKVGGDGNDALFHLLLQILDSIIFELSQYVGSDFFRILLLLFSSTGNHDLGLTVFTLNDFEGPGLHVILNDFIIEFATDEPLRVKDRVFNVLNDLCLGCITDESLHPLFSKRHK